MVKTPESAYNGSHQIMHQGQAYTLTSLPALAEKLHCQQLNRLPVSLKIVCENVLRHTAPADQTEAAQAFVRWVDQQGKNPQEIAYHPSRVLMQDFTGVPAVVDLAIMRDAVAKNGGDVNAINPQCPVDLVVDHSVQVQSFGQSDALQNNVNLEMLRNRERYQFLKWGQQAFDHFRVVPPGVGICHQVNLEYLAEVVWAKPATEGGQPSLYPDTVVGTDSHTTMVNALGVLGWGVGGIEAEAAMLGQPIAMLMPEVVGFELTGALQEGVTATDCVLTLVQMLREFKVVGQFVEFYGEGVSHLTLAERATIANMAPEYGATCGLFPIDDETLSYLNLTGRDAAHIALIEEYAKHQGLWHNPSAEARQYSRVLQVDLSTIEPCVAGPKRPQDRVNLSDLGQNIEQIIVDERDEAALEASFPIVGQEASMRHGDVVIAAITSCTNTSNPAVLIAAGLVAKAAVARGLTVKPWVKTSLAPGSRVVMDYLEVCDLVAPLEALGFHLVGYGCTTCIGNSGPLPEPIAETIDANDLLVCSVLSGNRNFEGRVHPQVQANWLASPPLVVAYALAGTTRLDLSQDVVAEDTDGNPVYLKDLWPSQQAIAEAMAHIQRDMFTTRYQHALEGDRAWQALPVSDDPVYAWDQSSTYIQPAPFFEGSASAGLYNIRGARLLALLGDSVTTDHISPAGSIAADSPAGRYLADRGVPADEFNSYGSRRGNHEVMMRGTFANQRIRNRLVPEMTGGLTKSFPEGTVMSIYDAAMAYAERGEACIVMAGQEYGTGSSRDWAAKGPALLGVRVVIAESYERIHRSNLIGMGVLPLEFIGGMKAEDLNLSGQERFDILGIDQMKGPGATLQLRVVREDGSEEFIDVQSRIDTDDELNNYQHGGILQTVVKSQSMA